MFPAINARLLTGSAERWPLSELAAIGYRSLELTPACLEDVAPWRAAADNAGMPVAAINALPDLTPYLTGSLSDNVAWRRNATLARMRRTISRMTEAAIRYLIVSPGRLAEIYQSPEEARALLVASLLELSDAAGGDAEVLLLGAPFRLFSAAVEVARLVDDVARPNVGAALDVGHALLSDESPETAAATLGARLRYVIVRDVDVTPGAPRLNRHLPLGEGSMGKAAVRAAIGDRPWSVGVTAPADPLAAARGALQWLSE